MKRKVFVGFSGGVDSSVSAHLLSKKYDVTAVMFKNIRNPECSQPVEKNAKEVAEHLEIPFLLVDFVDEFEHLVINPFIESYKKGETPNPCVTCNIQFKFDRFAKWCFEKGADMIATGHYCRTKNGHLYRGKDLKKDQSYFLNGVSSDILKKSIFPVGDMTKEKVREFASKKGLPNKNRGDSQEICFVDSTLGGYLENNIKSEKGDIVDIDSNEILGKHNGIHSLTLGQRRGIKIGGADKAYYVAKKNIQSNTIFVGKGKYNQALWKDTFKLENFNLIHENNKGINRSLTGMVRYRSKEIECNFNWDTSVVKFKEKVWTPSVGQSLVIYRNKECIGGGKIEDIRQ